MWEIGSAEAGSKEAQTYLNGGWEPFAVVFEISSSGPVSILKYLDYTGTNVIWFRRNLRMLEGDK